MPQTADDALRAMRPISDGQEYAMIGLPAKAIMAAAGVLAELGEPFAALVADAGEVTLVLPATALDAFARRLPEARVAETRYRLITLDVALEPTLVGFMARVATALAAAGIPILPLAAYSRDHLLVPAAQLDAAFAALERLRR
jgi:hypothetical protein